MRSVVTALLIALVLLHQDFWNWHTHEPLVFGVIPIGLAWHVGISLAAGFVGWLTITYCWPRELDALDAMPEGDAAAQARSRGGH